jgi:hypothetical protein
MAQEDHLFGLIELDSIEITPDDMAGRVCIRNVQSLLIRSRDKPNFVYEIPIEVLESKKIVVKLTPKVCKDLKVSNNKLPDFQR